jgi:hypothetical protein
MLGLVGIVFATLLTVITNELPVQLLTVNVDLARRVCPPRARQVTERRVPIYENGGLR